MLAKKIILSIILILWLGLIFYFSNQDALTSENTSDNVASIVIDKVHPNIEAKEKETLIENSRLIVRKSAHFLIFLVLGILVYLTLKTYNLSNVLILSILFCLVYALFDEIHQIFINERSFSLFDVLIDTFGSSIGILICNFLTIKFDKSRRKC